MYGFEWRKYLFRFDEEFIQNYDEDSGKRYKPEVDLDFPEELQKEPSDLSLLSKKTHTAKCEKLMSNLHDKKNYVIQIRALLQALDHNLILEKSLQGNSVQSKSMA